jgi:hypothetical protein
MLAGLTFLAPLALAALIVLPALYFLLRLTPPPPRRLPLPTLPLVRDILGREREPARTPWWLLVLRLAAAAAIILAVAGPRWQPPGSLRAESASGPLLLLLDDGWPAAAAWKTRIERATALIEATMQRPVLLIAASDEQPARQPETARAALSRLNSLAPKPWHPPRAAMFEAAAALLAASPDAAAIWISDGLLGEDEAPRIAAFRAAAGERLDIIAAPAATLRGLAGFAQNAEGLEAIIRRPAADGAPAPGLVRAYDDKGRPLGDAGFAFAPAATEARARLALPTEIVNDIARIEIADHRSAGAVQLLDGAHRRRRVALITGETADTAQPLVSGRYFLARALEPYSDLREPPRGVTDPIGRALEERPDILVLVDFGTLAGESASQVARFVENGGMLVRFAGPGLAASSDELLPVRLRRGGRILGGALSWDRPQKLGEIPEGSPFAGLTRHADVRIERQVLAEPDSELMRASWAVLEDGTPLVTGAQRGAGQIVLFHVTASTAWSNLPLSGLFVDMLRRLLLTAKGQAGGDSARGEVAVKLAPRLTLDGFGALSAAAGHARPVDARHTAPASRDHPPGYYGPPEAALAVNVLNASVALAAIDFGPAGPLPLENARSVDFRPALLLVAALLVIADSLAVALLGGAIARLRRSPAPAAGLGAGGFGLALLLLIAPGDAIAQGAEPRAVRPEDIRSSLRPRLAYIVTGNAQVDEASRAGLYGLGQILSQRTALQLDEPIGLDPARDELVFYSMIYWPVLAGQPMPSEAAIRAIGNFMRQGGTMVFDTRDAFIQRSGGQPTAETRALRQMLATLDIPALEPIPRDHVLTKTFYLLDRFTGRYVAGDSWVEALAGPSDSKVPARAGDRVSPIIITSNDLAAAWATDRLGNPLYPLVPGESRQREMAYRTGVNLVMYVFTGNYKADQVHVPALLERLGQ